jgi:hypothetical protein
MQWTTNNSKNNLSWTFSQKFFRKVPLVINDRSDSSKYDRYSIFSKKNQKLKNLALTFCVEKPA